MKEKKTLCGVVRWQYTYVDSVFYIRNNSDPFHCWLRFVRQASWKSAVEKAKLELISKQEQTQPSNKQPRADRVQRPRFIYKHETRSYTFNVFIPRFHFYLFRFGHAFSIARQLSWLSLVFIVRSTIGLSLRVEQIQFRNVLRASVAEESEEERGRERERERAREGAREGEEERDRKGRLERK